MGMQALFEHVFREVYGQAVATLVRVFGDIKLVENAVQDAFVVASDRWQRDGMPPHPAGWIVASSRFCGYVLREGGDDEGIPDGNGHIRVHRCCG